MTREITCPNCQHKFELPPLTPPPGTGKRGRPRQVSDDAVREIRALYSPGSFGYKRLADYMRDKRGVDVSWQTVRKVLKGWGRFGPATDKR